MGLVHLLGAAGVVADVAREDGLRLVALDVVVAHLLGPALDDLVADLAAPHLRRPAADQHLVDQRVLTLVDVLLQLQPLHRAELASHLSVFFGDFHHWNLQEG